MAKKPIKFLELLDDYEKLPSYSIYKTKSLKEYAIYRDRAVILSGEETTEYFKKRIDKSQTFIDFYLELVGQDLDLSVDRKSEPIDSRSMSTSSIPKLNISNISNKPELNLNYKEFKLKAGKIFKQEVIQSSFDREEETIRSMVQSGRASGLNLSNGKDVLAFLNGSYKQKVGDLVITYENEYDITFVTESIADAIQGGTGNIGTQGREKDPTSQYVSSSDSVKIEDVVRMLQSGVVYSPEIIGILQLISKARVGGKKTKFAEKSSKQAKAQSRTFTEHIARYFLDKKAQYFQNNPVLLDSLPGKALRVGGEVNKDFKPYLLAENSDLSKLTLEQIGKAADAFARDFMPERVGISFATGFARASGQSKDLSKALDDPVEKLKELQIVDLVFKTDVRDIYIDAKFGIPSASKGSVFGGRYTPSGGITTTIEQINSNFMADLSKEFMTNIEYAIDYFYTIMILGKQEKDDFKNQSLQLLISYAIFSSREFISHYRVDIESTFKSDFKFVQPDFLFTQAGLCWYSDFFWVIYNIYFNEENPKGLSFDLSKAFMSQEELQKYKEKAESKNKSTEVKREEYTEKMFQFVKDYAGTDQAEQMDKFKEYFIKSKIFFKIDISNFQQELNKIVKKGGSHT